MRRIILFLPVFLPTFLLARFLSTGAVRSHTTTVSTTAELKQALQLKLDEWHKAGSFPGATLGVVLPNGESFGLAVGLSDRELKTPMKPSDRMLAGSVGKTFAAATASQLVKEGKIGLDGRIEKYLGHEPWFCVCPMRKTLSTSRPERIVCANVEPFTLRLSPSILDV